MYFTDVEYNFIVSVIFIFIEYVEVQVYVSYRPFLLFDKKRKKPTEMYYNVCKCICK